MEARESKEALRDFCFQKIEEHAEDAKEGSNVTLDQISYDGKGFWDFCLDPRSEIEES